LILNVNPESDTVLPSYLLHGMSTPHEDAGEEEDFMIIGIPREIKAKEARVAMTPEGVKAVRIHGHQVFVQSTAGEGSGFSDDEYQEVGATILATADEVWAKAEMIVKVKEPLAAEYKYMREGLIIFTYLHLAAARELTEELLERGVTGISYETIELPDGSLPLLIPMSEVAGRLAVQMGSWSLEAPNGGRGILLPGVVGVAPGQVLVLGAGTVGRNAIQIAMGLGARVVAIDKNPSQLRYLDDIYHGRLVTLVANAAILEAELAKADLVIGAILLAGAKAPRVIKREHLKIMKPGSVIVDVSIDQGGIAETSKPTTHDDPVYVVDGVVHYCVANMPGAVPMAANRDPALALGFNTWNGKLTCKGVAEAFDIPLEELPRR
jgi:alanine dehydrogenase